ncbi:MAG: hypothetical protein LBT01_00705 [Spirochaetaceae bacterium]|jgi:hypothetical protein|nr:hypothetical protein [Spirochaetaceae bacterium]
MAQINFAQHAAAMVARQPDAVLDFRNPLGANPQLPSTYIRTMSNACNALIAAWDTIAARRTKDHLDSTNPAHYIKVQVFCMTSANVTPPAAGPPNVIDFFLNECALYMVGAVIPGIQNVVIVKSDDVPYTNSDCTLNTTETIDTYYHQITANIANFFTLFRDGEKESALKYFAFIVSEAAREHTARIAVITAFVRVCFDIATSLSVIQPGNIFTPILRRTVAAYLTFHPPLLQFDAGRINEYAYTLRSNHSIIVTNWDNITNEHIRRFNLSANTIYPAITLDDIRYYFSVHPPGDTDLKHLENLGIF